MEAEAARGARRVRRAAGRRSGDHCRRGPSVEHAESGPAGVASSDVPTAESLPRDPAGKSRLRLEPDRQLRGLDDELGRGRPPSADPRRRGGLVVGPPLARPADHPLLPHPEGRARSRLLDDVTVGDGRRRNRPGGAPARRPRRVGAAGTRRVVAGRPAPGDVRWFAVQSPDLDHRRLGRRPTSRHPPSRLERRPVLVTRRSDDRLRRLPGFAVSPEPSRDLHRVVRRVGPGEDHRRQPRGQRSLLLARRPRARMAHQGQRWVALGGQLGHPTGTGDQVSVVGSSSPRVPGPGTCSIHAGARSTASRPGPSTTRRSTFTGLSATSRRDFRSGPSASTAPASAD